MKILIEHGSPFLLAHGGVQVQIEQTKAGLQAIGVDVDFLRWWDDSQKGDIIHCYNRSSLNYINRAHDKGIKVIISPLLTGQGSRPRPVLWAQRQATRLGRKLFPDVLKSPFGWDSFAAADACIALTEWEGHLMSYIFGASPEKVHVIPNGVEEVFFKSASVTRDRWLVCTATITERKRVLELAKAAVAAQTPLWIVGKPYAEQDPYAQSFFHLAKTNPAVIRYDGPVQDRVRLAQIYRQARGFVLLSAMESLSLSALEAAACECPLLLSDLPWARMVFREDAMYCPIGSLGVTAKTLRRFYDAAPHLKPPAKPLSWVDVAQQMKAVYQRVLAES